MSIAEWRIWREQELAQAFDASHALSAMWKKKYICPASLSFSRPFILLGLREKGFHEQAVCHSGCVYQCTECSR